MDPLRAARIVALMLSPSAAIGTVLYLPRLARRALRLVRSDAGAAAASRAPIEALAADLRRLLARHDALRRSPRVAMRAHHLWALEAAIADSACLAAEALDMPRPPRPASGRLPAADLQRLLRDLAGAGLAIPAGVGRLGAES